MITVQHTHNLWTCVALADVTAMLVLLEAIITVHHAHDIITLMWFLFLAETGITTIVVLLEAMLTVQHTHNLWTCVALADVTAMLVLLEAIITVHQAHDIITLMWFLL